MSRDYRLYLDDILKSVERIKTYTKKHNSAKQLHNDPVAFDAVAFNLEVIGEAVKNIPKTVKGNYPEIEWKNIAGMRDKIIQHYHDINPDIIWDVVETKLTPLKKLITKILSEMDQQ